MTSELEELVLSLLLRVEVLEENAGLSNAGITTLPPKPAPERRPYDPAVDGAPTWSSRGVDATAATKDEFAEQRDAYQWYLASTPGYAMVDLPNGVVLVPEKRGTPEVAEMKAEWEQDRGLSGFEREPFEDPAPGDST